MGFQFIDRSNSTTKTGLLEKQTQLNCSRNISWYTTSQTLFCVIDLQRTRVMKEKVHELYWCFVWLVFSCDETILSDSTSISNTLDFTNRSDQSSTHLTRHKSASGETCSSETDVTSPVSGHPRHSRRGPRTSSSCPRASAVLQRSVVEMITYQHNIPSRTAIPSPAGGQTDRQHGQLRTSNVCPDP